MPEIMQNVAAAPKQEEKVETATTKSTQKDDTSDVSGSAIAITDKDVVYNRGANGRIMLDSENTKKLKELICTYTDAHAPTGTITAQDQVVAKVLEDIRVNHRRIFLNNSMLGRWYQMSEKEVKHIIQGAIAAVVGSWKKKANQAREQGNVLHAHSPTPANKTPHQSPMELPGCHVQGKPADKSEHLDRPGLPEENTGIEQDKSMHSGLSSSGKRQNQGTAKGAIGTINSRHERFLKLGEDSRVCSELADVEAKCKVKDAVPEPRKRPVKRARKNIHYSGVAISGIAHEDFLCCEGYSSHPGNLKFEALILSNSNKYARVTNGSKLRFVRKVVGAFGTDRFLAKDNDSGLWHQLDDTAVLNLTKRALSAGNNSKNILKAAVSGVGGTMKRKVLSQGFPTYLSGKRLATVDPSSDAVHKNVTVSSDETSTLLGEKEKKAGDTDHPFTPASDSTTLHDSLLESVATEVKGGVVVQCITPTVEMTCTTQVDDSNSMENSLVFPGPSTIKSNALHVHSFTPVSKSRQNLPMEIPGCHVQVKSTDDRNEHLSQLGENTSLEQDKGRNEASKEIGDSNDQKNNSMFHDHDILSGRGNGVHAHPGNVYLRNLIRKYQRAYMESERRHKILVIKDVINEIEGLNPPGRFLEKTGNACYTVMSGRKAQTKVSQAFRDNSLPSRPIVASSGCNLGGITAHENGNNNKRLVTGWIDNRPGNAGP